MGKPCEKIAHPEEFGGCGSSDGLQVFEEDGKYNGYCFSCKTYVKNPYAQYPEDYKPEQKPKKSPDQIKKEIEEIQTYPIKEIKDRGIYESTCEHYDVRVGLSETNGEDITSHFYPYTNAQGELSAYSVRVCNPKKFFGIGSRRNSLPFGWNKRLGTKALYITEGELDAMSLYQILRESAEEWVKKKGNPWNDRYVPDVISLPTGASSASRVLTEIGEEIRRTYKEVRIVFDNDEAGRNAVTDAVKALGGDDKLKVFVATLPKKDVNDCLMSGMAKDVINACVYNASEKISGKILRSNELWDLAKERPKQGNPWPWEGMTRLTRGKRLGEVYYFGAGVKMGLVLSPFVQ